jgi:hypothetical protein
MARHLFLFLISVCAFSQTLIAQDTLTMRNGDVFAAKVEEVGTTEVKYHKSDNLSGPLYSVAKSDVFMIKYENGSKDVFSNAETRAPAIQPTEIRKKRFEPSVMQDYIRLNKMANKRFTAGAIITGAGGVLLVSGIAIFATEVKASQVGRGNLSNQTAAPLLIVAGIAACIVGPITLGKGFKYRRMAQKSAATVGFSPIINVNIERYNSLTKNNIGSLTFTF